MALQLYATFHVALDGRIQEQMCALHLSSAVNADDEIAITSVVPASGFEFDPRECLGTDRVVDVALIYNSGDGTIAAFKAKVVALSFSKRLGTPNESTVTFTLRREPRAPAPE